MTALEQLKARLGEVSAINSAAELLGWDQQTYMPSGGGGARAAQMAALSQASHERSVSAETEALLAQAERDGQGLDPDSDDAAYLRVARRDFDKKTRLPASLVAETARVTALAYEEWARARAESDFSRFAPWLEKIVDLARQTAQHLGYAEEMYDALLDQFEPGMTTRQVRAMYEAIKPQTVSMVQAIAQTGAPDDSILRREFDEARQARFGEQVVRALGFDFGRGRQDRAVHPFCASFSSGDVRITTRFDKNWLPMALFGSIHETGHGLYEQGIADRYDGNVLGGGTSLGFHESQSRLWENLVGRSRPFWEHFYPGLRDLFPESLGDVPQDDFYRAINVVAPSLIRVEADEVTYNLHTLLRFELEIELLEGRLPVADTPAAWNAKMEEYLGLTPPDDAHGVLQDVHWSSGILGYFPTYSVGNIYSVQLFDRADRELGGIGAQVAAGEFRPLLDWLRRNVHLWGRKYTPSELIHRITGGPLDPAPYLRYLRVKFGDIYTLPE